MIQVFLYAAKNNENIGCETIYFDLCRIFNIFNSQRNLRFEGYAY